MMGLWDHKRMSRGAVLFYTLFGLDARPWVALRTKEEDTPLQGSVSQRPLGLSRKLRRQRLRIGDRRLAQVVLAHVGRGPPA